MLKYYLLLYCLLINWAISAQPALEKQIQTQLILAEDGDEIRLPEGTLQITGSLSLEGKKDIVITGAGQGKTILSFSQQKQGAEGLKITNSERITVRNFTIENSKGDLIKTQNVQGITFQDLTAQWTGEPNENNGSYALYPVQCSGVLIERCTAIGASDAGIYVGQSDDIIVRNCMAKFNVAGIEIENSTHAKVYDNLATENTGGILVFDLPDLPKKQGGDIEVYNNRIEKNNYRNFAPKGNIVGQVPAGTGVMILAGNNVRVHNNQILNNKTASTTIISYFITEIPIQDKDYDPYPADIAIYDNTFSTGKRMPTLKHKIGKLFFLKFGKKVPHILYDGIANPAHLSADGQLLPAYRICVKNNTNGSFVNLRADRKFKGMIRSTEHYTCP
jgi:parallel beta-helix repeat protein